MSFFYAILAGYLLFAHGCHGGDEDHELMLTPSIEMQEKKASEQSCPEHRSEHE